MRLHLERLDLQPGWTIGRLLVDEHFECFTLEDAVRDGPKIPGQTAIPFGHYPIAITWSPRFRRDLPLLEYVRGFTGVRIHPGNVAADTDGCILVGVERGPGALRRSREAFDALFPKLLAAQKAAEPITIDITR